MLAKREQLRKEAETASRIASDRESNLIKSKELDVTKSFHELQGRKLDQAILKQQEMIELKKRELDQNDLRHREAQQLAAQNEARRLEAAKAEAEYKQAMLSYQKADLGYKALVAKKQLAQTEENAPLMRQLEQATRTAMNLLDSAFQAQAIMDNPELAKAAQEGASNLIRSVASKSAETSPSSAAAVGRALKEKTGKYAEVPDEQLGAWYLEQQSNANTK